MSIVLVKKRIVPKKKLDVPGARKIVEQALEDTVKDVKKDYATITKAWKHQPDVDSDYELRGIDATVLVGVDDKVFNYLDKGTKVRYALMRPGYKRKTKPGRLSSTAGGGGVRYIGKARPAYYSKRKRWPLKGIKARNWTPILQRRARKVFLARISKDIKGIKFV